MADKRKLFEGLKLLEFGSGAAGPIATRYLADHGATVVRVESRVRPDFLRVYPPHIGDPKDLDGAIFFDVLNCNKLSITINLRDPRGGEVARRLVAWCDLVTENFSPGNMAKFGLSYDELIKIKPDLIMVSGCLQGQTGPHKDYPGFGGQGSALSGFNYWAGWPDREPVGPNGTISDTLAPRLMATSILGALHYRRRTGKGVHLDLSQV
ncbi:MAG: CoA transferase, partial [Chloroflexi bacterium]|nr:CoA transferase [Chloroflexota bacterium]